MARTSRKSTKRARRTSTPKSSKKARGLNWLDVSQLSLAIGWQLTPEQSRNRYLPPTEQARIDALPMSESGKQALKAALALVNKVRGKQHG